MRTIEVHFSDDAVRRGEVDDSNLRIRTLVAAVRKLFGLGPIPLALSCVVDGELFEHLFPFLTLLSIAFHVSSTNAWCRTGPH